MSEPEEFYSRHYSKLYRIAERKLRRERAGVSCSASDLLQDVFIGVWQRSASSVGTQVLFRQIRRALDNRLISLYRHRTAKKRGGESCRISLLSDVHCDVEGGQQKELRNDVEECLESLAERSARSAQVVRMVYQYNMTQEEVAAELELPRRTVRDHLDFARCWIRREFAANC